MATSLAVAARRMQSGKGGDFICLLEGNSMEPVLRERDLLLIEAYDGRRILRGDVIVFKGEYWSTFVAHRVAQVTEAGFRTRGDGNTRCDGWTVASSDVVGKVASLWRAGKKVSVLGGTAGRALVSSLRLRLLMNRLAVAAFHCIYFKLAELGILRRLLSPGVQPRVVAFGAGEEPHLRLLLGRRVVGQYRRWDGSWQIKRPFRLLVDEARLPTPGRDEVGGKTLASVASSGPRLCLDATRDFPPEIELLLSCARTTLDEEGAYRIRELSKRVRNWDRVLRLVRKHGLTALVHRSLLTAEPEGVPVEYLDQLGLQRAVTARHNLLLAKALLRVLDLLGEAGICAIPLKGPVLAVSAYGDLSLRPSSDLDVLVPMQDVGVAHDVLVRHGFSPAAISGLADGSSRPNTDGRWYHAPYRGMDPPIALELHWGFVPAAVAGGITPDRLVRGLTMSSLLGNDILSLSLEDHLLFLCIHGTYHLWGSMLWICDLAELCRNTECIDWDDLFVHARRLGCARMLHVGIHLASGLLEAPLEQEILACGASDRVAKSLAESAVANSLSTADRSSAWKGNNLGFFLSSRERLQDKMAILLGVAFDANERDEKLLPLPKSFGFLRVLLRPFRLLVDYGLGRLVQWFSAGRRNSKSPRAQMTQRDRGE